MSIIAITVVHTVISLIGIITGLVVAGGFVAGRRLDGWVGLFLLTTVLTNATGFLFPLKPFLPSHVLAIISLVVLAFVIPALYVKHLAGGWRRVFVVGSVFALYVNMFVLVNQLFLRLPVLLASAPTQKEPPFVVTQLLTLALFVWLGWAADRGFRGEAATKGSSER
jgi:hypothetical protein